MKKAIIGKKVGMTQIFDEVGNVIPVTVIQAGPCVISQKKTVENDGYDAVQMGFSDVKLKYNKKARSEKFNQKPSNISMPLYGHFVKADVAPKKVLKEFRLENCNSYNVGDVVKADLFEVNEKVDVIGTSKGKGYAGTIKRYNFSRLKETHGSGPVVRHAGSMGACSDPSRVFKGKKLPGHMGHERVTVKNLQVIKVFSDENIIAVKGAIPGPKGSVVMVCANAASGKENA